MSSGQPNWGKILNRAIERNNKLREQLDMEPREEVTVDIPSIARQIIEENGKLHQELLKKTGQGPVKAEAPKKEEPKQAELTCDECGHTVCAKTEGAAKALLTKHQKEHDKPQGDEPEEKGKVSDDKKKE